jgi:hypothetical protein
MKRRHGIPCSQYAAPLPIARGDGRAVADPVERVLVGGTANTACGLTGAVCSDCTQIPSATCVSGLCEAPSSNCPSTCAGCCDTNNVCHASSSAQYCFTNGGNPFAPGSACEDCVAESDLFCLHILNDYACSPIP